MARIVLGVAPDPAQLGVIRMTAASAVRSHDVADCLVEDLRSAIDEVCGRAIAAHQDAGIDDQFTVEIEMADDHMQVRVADHVSHGTGTSYVEYREGAMRVEGDDVCVPESLAVVGGLADRLDVRFEAGGTTVTMCWSL